MGKMDGNETLKNLAPEGRPNLAQRCAGKVGELTQVPEESVS